MLYKNLFQSQKSFRGHFSRIISEAAWDKIVRWPLPLMKLLTVGRTEIANKLQETHSANM